MPCRDASAILVESRMQLPIAICFVTQLMSLWIAIDPGACAWPPLGGASSFTPVNSVTCWPGTAAAFVFRLVCGCSFFVDMDL